MAGRTWLVGTFVGAMGVAALTVAPAADAAPGDVEAVLEQVRQWLGATGAGELVTSAPPVVTAGSDGDLVRLPGLVLQSPDARIGFGDVEFVRSDARDGLWRLAGSLPPQITVEVPGLPAAIVTTEQSSYRIEIDPQSGVLGDTAIEAGGLTAAVEPLGRVRIGAVRLGGDIEHGADGKATATSTYALSDLSFAPGAAGAGELARIGGISLTGRIGGADWARILALQTFVLANQAGLEDGDDPALLDELRDLMTTPGLPFDGVELRFALERAWVGDLGGGGPVSVDEAGFHFGVDGLTGGTAGGRIGYGHRGLRIEAALPVDAAAVPETLSFELGIERVPAGQLLAALAEGADDETALLDLLRHAGTTARIAGARIRMNGMGADLDAEVAASPDAAGGMLGRAVLAVVNLDGIVRALGPLVADETAAIQALALTGQRSEAPGGAVTHRWTVAREADGRTTLNGNDIDALLREEDMASLSGRLGGGPAEAAAQQAAAGITAGLVATRLEELGVAATVGEDDSGDPMVEAVPPHGPDGAGMGAVFFDCEPGGPCGSGMLYFTLPTERPVALARVNGWNGSERWVRTYRDDDQLLWLEMDLPGEAGGVAAVDAALERFLDLAARFADDMGPD